LTAHRDPVTGDELTTEEWVSWKIQGAIRRWYFLILITLVTIAVWATNNPTALTWWNLGASYAALVIESIVGIAMFSQTRRDAVVLREVRSTLKEVRETADQTERIECLLLKHIETLEQELS